MTDRPGERVGQRRVRISRSLAAGVALAAIVVSACGTPKDAAPARTVTVPESAPAVTDAPTPAVTVAPAEQPESDAGTRIDRPATVTTPADRVDSPVRVEWIGGSDVAWQGVSLPDGFLSTVDAVQGRPLDLRPRLRQGALAPDVRAMVGEALGERAEALIVSFNPVWLHLDDGSCDDITVPRTRYACLLTPVSAAITAERDREIEALVDAIVGAGVPVYVYMQPHSSDVLADPVVAPLIAAAEERLAGFDPGVAEVRWMARSFTRDTQPMREGIEFHDMVHPTPDGAAVLGPWLAADVAAFWDSLGFGR